MRQIKNHFLLAAIAGLITFASCQKSSVNDGNVSPEQCVTGRSVSASRNGDIIEGQYIVTLKSGSTAKTMSTQSVQTDGSKVLERHAIGRAAIAKSFAGGRIGGFIAKLSRAEAKALEEDESVDIVEPDRIIALSTCFTVVEPRLVTWSANRIGYGDGTGKTAWIIDTGIDFDHPDLNVDVTRSRSFISGQTSADDENGHGTHVAGIIGAKNNSIGMLGIASGCNLVSLRVLGADGEGTYYQSYGRLLT